MLRYTRMFPVIGDNSMSIVSNFGTKHFLSNLAP
jgi:hypothetical protein